MNESIYEETFNIKKGWNLLAHSFAINPNEFKNDIIWSYKDNKWYCFSKDKQLLNIFDTNNVDFVDAIRNYQGYWVYSDLNTSVNPSIIYQNDFEVPIKNIELTDRGNKKAFNVNKSFATYVGTVNLNGITLTAWVKFNELKDNQLFGIFDGGNYIKIILNYAKQTTTHLYDDSTKTYSNWNINFCAITNTGYAQISDTIVNDLKNTKIEKDKWYFIAIAITKDGNYTMWYNDKIVGSGSTKIVFPEEVGGYEEYVDITKIKDITLFINNFQGNIDNIKIDNKILNNEEIKQLYYKQQN